MLSGVANRCECAEQDRKLKLPPIQSYLPPYVGHTIALGVFYPLEKSTPDQVAKQRAPFLITTCVMCRLVVGRRIRLLKPMAIGRLLVDSRIQVYGRTVGILSDKGPGSQGESWTQFCAVWSCAMIHAPTDAAHSNGLVERQIDLIKLGYAKAKPLMMHFTDEDIISHVAMARNLTPLLNIGMAPLMCATDRIDLRSPLEVQSANGAKEYHQDPDGTLGTNLQVNLPRIMDIRAKFMDRDAHHSTESTAKESYGQGC